MSIVRKSGRARIPLLRRCRYSTLLVLALVPLLAFAVAGGVRVAHADGGAPNLLYISGVKDGVAVVDIASQQVTNTIKVTGDPRGLVLSTDSRFLYVALAGKDGIAVIDTLAKQVIHTYATGPGPESLILDLIDPTNLWVANSGGSTVTVLNPDSGKKAATISVGLHPVSVALAGPTSGINETDGTSEALVANEDGASLTVIGSESFKVMTTVPLPNNENPLWVTVPAFGGTAYVTTKQGHVFGFTLAGHQFFGPIFTGKVLHGMDYDAVTGQVYVPDSQTNQINVLRPVSSGQTPPTSLPSQPQRTIAVSGGPAFVAITSDGSLGLVGQQTSGDISFLDVPGHRLSSSIHVGGTPQFVLAGPFPPLVNRQSAQVILIIIYVFAGILLVGGIVWLIWWMRKQERRIRALHAQEDAEYERQLLAAQESAMLNGQASPESQGETEEQDSADANGPPRRNSTGSSKAGPKNQRKRQT